MPVTVDRALPLFTAHGERQWVSGWDPQFPAGDEALDMTVGTVWLNRAHGTELVWTVADSAKNRIRYVRVIPGIWAGIVEITCSPTRDDPTSSDVQVVYDTTPLSSKGNELLTAFADGHDAFLRGWESDIMKACR